MSPDVAHAGPMDDDAAGRGAGQKGSARPLFTVLLPVVRPPAMLPFAIESVLEQDLSEFELFIICDGAPPETVACAQDYARRDPRVRVFAFPKGQRNGESHRHTALGHAAGRYVAQIADDDLWFPNHLEELETLLSGADFGNLLHVYLNPDGKAEILPGDLGDAEMRRRMLAGEFNLFGPSVAGYRLDAYRRLPQGWSPAPVDIWSDLYMWQKFLRMEDLRIATRAAVTAVILATPHRQEVTLDERREESRMYLERIRDAKRRGQIVEAAWHSLLDRHRECERQLIFTIAARDRAIPTAPASDARGDGIDPGAVSKPVRPYGLPEWCRAVTRALRNAIAPRDRE